MTKIYSIELLQEMIDKGYVSSRKHNTADLWILNYTPKAAYERVWNEITMVCRGMIVDAEYNIVARPFVKFFNYEEIEPVNIPINSPFTATDKLDGSMGILYWIDDVPYIATRGSFNSEQAIHATKILHEKYAEFIPLLNKDISYLFEIVYPENRIVLDYHGVDDIFLIGMLETGCDYEYELGNFIMNPGFNTTTVFDGITDFTKLRDIARDNAEGFVIRFSNGFRMKMKYAEYVRLHRIVTNTSSYTIHEALSSGQSLDSYLENVPDEFFSFVKRVGNDLLEKYEEIQKLCWDIVWFVTDEHEITDRKEIAEIFKKEQKYAGILFSMLDGKDYSKAIWKMIKPKYERPFSDNTDESA